MKVQSSRIKTTLKIADFAPKHGFKSLFLLCGEKKKKDPNTWNKQPLTS